MKQRQWRRLISIGVIATLLLGLVATGLGIDALRKINKIEKLTLTAPATSIVTPDGGATISGVVNLDATAIGPKITAVEFLATGGSYQDAKIATGKATPVGWVAQWETTRVRNGTYQITSVGYDAAGQSSSSTSVTVKVANI